jgi:6-phosphogluconolactonase
LAAGEIARRAKSLSSAADSTARREVLPDPDALARRVADWLLDLTLSKKNDVAVCLSGGSTPQRLFRLMAAPPYRGSFPWPHLHLFWGDERFVPQTDARSNFRMVHEALLSRVPIPAANVHPIPTEHTDPEAAAEAYESMLKKHYGADRLLPARPLFDVTLLGLGADGHTASLFPGTSALAERRRWAAPVIGAADEARITLTYPALESSRQVAFLVEGEEKRPIVARLAKGDADLPAAHLKPVGQLTWFLDQAAAGI